MQWQREYQVYAVQPAINHFARNATKIVRLLDGRWAWPNVTLTVTVPNAQALNKMATCKVFVQKQQM